ncbi:MAG: hypothetical protein V4576_02365 [Patescibacteria group bacterium]
MKYISALFSFLPIATAVHAALPPVIPTTERAAFVWAVTKTRFIERDIWATPVGRIEISAQGNLGGSLSTYKKFALTAPSSGEKIKAITAGDKFKVSLPTAKSNYNLWYRTNDGNPEVTMLEAFLVGSFIKSGNAYVIPEWSKDVTYYLSSKFHLETEADYMDIQFLDDDGNVTYESLEAKEIGGKKYFVFPSDYFVKKEYQNGITTLWGKDENGNYQYRQYTNIDGNLAGTQFVNMDPNPIMANHFAVKPTQYSDGNFEAYLPVPSYEGTITDRSYEFVAGGPEGSIRQLFIYSLTTPAGGVGKNYFATGVTATEQAPDGTIRPVRGFGETRSPAIIMQVKAGCTYIFSVNWPEEVKHSQPWFN